MEVINMRGDAFRRAMEHAEPKLAKAIWDDLISPKPSREKILEEEARKIELQILQARKKHARAV